MQRLVKTLLLSMLLTAPALAQTPAATSAVPYPPKAADYPDAEIRATLQWQELVQKTNEDRMRRKAAEVAARSRSSEAPSQTQPH